MKKQKFREFTISTGKKIFAGKNAEDNDRLIKAAKTDDIIFHTEKPGSPFVNVGKNPSKKEIKQATIFCALKSQDWRDNKQDVIIHKFKRKNMSKKSKKPGLWNVKKFKKIKIKKSEIKDLEKSENKNETN